MVCGISGVRKRAMYNCFALQHSRSTRDIAITLRVFFRHFYKGNTFHDFLGPVVQSIVSLKKSLGEDPLGLTVLKKLIAEIFLLKNC